jgi:hypothetical protein
VHFQSQNRVVGSERLLVRQHRHCTAPLSESRFNSGPPQLDCSAASRAAPTR